MLGLGVRALRLGSRVWGLGFRVLGLGFWGVRNCATSKGLGVQGLGS